MSDSDADFATEVLHCPCCGQDDKGFDGMGHRADHFVRQRPGDEGQLDAFQVEQIWYHFHCGDCGTEFQVLEKETETVLDSGQEAEA